MKVLFVINGLGTGGAERSLSELLQAAPADLAPTVVCLNRRSEGVQDPSIERGLDVRFMGDRGPTDRVRRIRRTIDRLEPALVHTTIFDADLAGRLAAAGTHVPVLTSLVNTPYETVRRDDPGVTAWKLRAVKAIDGWTARHLTTHFHAITHAVKDAAVRDLRISPSLVTVIERGRDPGRLGEPSTARRIQARRALGLEGDAFILLSVGRQEFQKGQWNLLEAMPQVHARVPRAVLLLAGRSGNASARLLETSDRLSLDGEIRFLGHRDDVPELFAAADVFVFPSLYEGLGGALIEAMALGLPIVASDLPAVREVVEDGANAVLVPAGSPEALASAVSELEAEPERRRRMGERSRRIFVERFTLERSARRMVELFERVASEGRPRR